MRNQGTFLLSGKYKDNGRGGGLFTCTSFGGYPLSPFPSRQRKMTQSAEPLLRVPGEKGANLELSLHVFNNGSLSPSHFTEGIIRLKCPGH